MNNRYLLIDGPSIAHAANSLKPLKVGNSEVQAIFHFVKMLRNIVATYRATPVVLWDGASWRNMLEAEYKANRTQMNTKAEIQAQNRKKSLNKQLPAIKKALEILGVRQVRASNMEADDLAAIVGDRYIAKGGSVVLISGDKDWIQLVGPKMIWFDPIRDRKIRNNNDLKEVLGIELQSLDQFVEFKSLTGDSGDNVAGVGGIGDKGASQFLMQYKSFADFLQQVTLEKTIDPAKLPKKFRDLVQDETKALRFSLNMDLMDLRTNRRPDPVNLMVNKGKPDLEKFRKFCNAFMFKSITKNLDVWASAFQDFPLTEDA